MRSALALGGLLALLTTAGPVSAQSSGGPGEQMEVIPPEVDVYSGPGDQCYATGKLRGGERVWVLRKNAQDPSWLEIKPPSGSFSWIESKWVSLDTKDRRIGRVHAPEGVPVPVLAGSTGYKGEPKISGGNVVRGTLLQIRESTPGTAPPSSFPLIGIEPVPTEVRYIRADVVRPASGIQLAANTGQQTPVGSGAAPAAGQATDLMKLTQQLYQQAHNDPNLDQAQRQQVLNLLQQAQGVMNRSGGTQGGIPIAQPGHPGNTGGTPGQLVSNPGRQQTTLYPNNSAPAPTPAPGQPQMKWSSWGLLQKAPVQKDGQQMYRLSDARGMPVLYAVPEAGKTLDPYVGKVVALYGSVVYRSDEFIRMDFMTVSYVAPPQAPAR
jgi:hypothetical protein